MICGLSVHIEIETETWVSGYYTKAKNLCVRLLTFSWSSALGTEKEGGSEKR